jgi:hypothetical protein
MMLAATRQESHGSGEPCYAGRHRDDLAAGLVVATILAVFGLLPDATLRGETDAESWAMISQDGGVEAPCDCPPSSGVMASAEWLNWQAHRGGMDFASFVDPIWLTPAARESLDYDRDNGLRLGLGYRFASGWDVSWNYTYFQTSAAGSVDQAANPGLVLIATRSYFDLAVDSVAAWADLDYGVHDIEAGRRFVWDNNAEVRLFGGFRWATIDQSESHRYTYQDLGGPVTGTIDGRSELDAYGIRLGAQTQWTTRWGLGLFGRLAGSVLVGSFGVQQQEGDDENGTILNFTDEYYQAVPVVDAAAGAAWTHEAWQVAGGYEMTTWFNMAEIERASYDLVLDGFFLRLAYAR